MNPQTTPTQTTRLTRRATSAAEEEATPSADATPVPTRPAKRARLHVAPSESTQVSTLAEFRLPLLDADCFFVPDLVSDAIAQNWYDGLVGIEGWYQPKLKMYGKEITQSRKIAAFATDPALVVKYSGQFVEMQYDYPPLLRKIQDVVEARLGISFNHCMLNNYEDGKIYIGKHRDNRENRVIASLSLGAPRTFIMTHSPLSSSTPAPPTSQDLVREKAWKLPSGSLLVMQGTTQEFWKHEIPKEPKIKEGRISLTFRQLVF